LHGHRADYLDLMPVKRNGFLTIAIAACLAQAPGAGAATLTPTTTTDEFGAGGLCSLREALDHANANADIGRGCGGVGFGNDVIVLTDPAGYTLTRPQDMVPSPDDNLEGDLDVAPVADGDPVTITATVPTTIDGGQLDRVIDVRPGATLNLTGMTIRNGLQTALGAGGIRVGVGSTLNLSDATLTQNSTSCCAGGAIGSQGTTTLTNVTLSGNSSAGHGGGLELSAGTTNLNSVTITGNTNVVGGAGSGGGLNAFGGNVNLRDTIVAGNTDASAALTANDCNQGAGGGTITSLGNNLIGDTAGCFFVALASDITNQPAGLGALATNGGLTQTHALMEGSRAIDTGSGMCPAADQRGVARPQRSACDIGAFELEPVPPAVPASPLAPAPATPPKAKKCKRKKKKRAGASAAKKKKRCKPKGKKKRK
jgi:CSLREA domain-containing protein